MGTQNEPDRGNGGRDQHQPDPHVQGRTGTGEMRVRSSRGFGPRWNLCIQNLRSIVHAAEYYDYIPIIYLHRGISGQSLPQKNYAAAIPTLLALKDLPNPRRKGGPVPFPVVILKRFLLASPPLSSPCEALSSTQVTFSIR